MWTQGLVFHVGVSKLNMGISQDVKKANHLLCKHLFYMFILVNNRNIGHWVITQNEFLSLFGRTLVYYKTFLKIDIQLKGPHSCLFLKMVNFLVNYWTRCCSAGGHWSWTPFGSQKSQVAAFLCLPLPRKSRTKVRILNSLINNLKCWEQNLTSWVSISFLLSGNVCWITHGNV